VIVVGGLLLIRLFHMVADRILRLMASGDERMISEREKRARTLASFLRTMGTTLVVIVGAMMALREFGLDITPLLAGAGVVGLAIGFGAQSLIKVLGVESLSDSQVTIRMMVKTVPLKQWDVARELRRRIKARFDQEGIRTPQPQRVILTRSSTA
jgi:small-conductance mechanosensitive channel